MSNPIPPERDHSPLWHLDLGPPWEVGQGGEHEINLNIFAAFEGFCRERRKECDRLSLHGCMDVNQLSKEFFSSLVKTYGDAVSQRDAFLFKQFRECIVNIAKVVGEQPHDDDCGTERPGLPFNSMVARREYNIERMRSTVQRLVPAMKKWDVPFDSETGNARKNILNMTDDMYMSAAWKWAFELERNEVDPLVKLPDPYKGLYRKSHLPESILELYYSSSQKSRSYEQKLEEAIIMIEHCKGNVLNFLKESEFSIALHNPWTIVSRYRSNHRKDRLSKGDPVAPALRRPNVQQDHEFQRGKRDTIMDTPEVGPQYARPTHEAADVEPASNTKVPSSTRSRLYSYSPDLHHRADQVLDMDTLMDSHDISDSDTHGTGTQYVTDVRSQQLRREPENLAFMDVEDTSKKDS